MPDFARNSIVTGTLVMARVTTEATIVVDSRCNKQEIQCVENQRES